MFCLFNGKMTVRFQSREEVIRPRCATDVSGIACRRGTVVRPTSTYAKIMHTCRKGYEGQKSDYPWNIPIVCRQTLG